VSIHKNLRIPSIVSFLAGFRGGYSDFDQFINNAPDFNNQFPPPPRPAFQIYQQYGQDYGYSSPFDNFVNPFF
jgi:hypothetical protein